MNFIRKLMYRAAFWFFRLTLFCYHPVFHVRGRENLPKDACILASNHAGAADPLWILLALRYPTMIRILAKQELRSWPFCGWYMKMMQVIFVKRGCHDEEAYNDCVDVLKGGEQLLIFIEGTRCHGDKHVPAKTGAIRMAMEAGVPIVPVYVTKERKPFGPVEVIFGKSCSVVAASDTEDAVIRAAAQELLHHIYEMGGECENDQTCENSGLLLWR